MCIRDSYERALHVFQEAKRQDEFIQICSKNQVEEADVRRLGELMSEGHRSSSELFDYSNPTVNKLVELCQQLGAFGARITGKGWGDCLLVLISNAKASKFVEHIQKEYYGPQEKQLFITDDLNVLAFNSIASGSSAILDPQYEIWYV
eukprot:TRINITY_DN12916_c0_g1_i1.p1 TRINITY_DN12916_c0_g1~~TRINITY_DN12916_c0_g1_i1.p1  ORF type:complete len:148 (+),score=16.54 TRINITY_DN12916_c0_g1_i1:64-507(+)